MKPPNCCRTCRGIFAAIALCALLATTALLAAGCSAGGEEPEYVCPYTWENLQSNNGRLAYYENGVLRSELGVDVSQYQGSIDWNAVAADGISFAFVRIANRGTTEGGLYEDATWRVNLEGARAAGLKVGVYIYSQATNAQEGAEEADYVLGLLNGCWLDLPIAYDNEASGDGSHRVDKASGSDARAAASAFCERITAGGYEALFYGCQDDLKRIGATNGSTPIWLAAYGVSHPSVKFDFAIWQYTNNGSVNGIPNAVDMNIRFLDAAL